MPTDIRRRQRLGAPLHILSAPVRVSRLHLGHRPYRTDSVQFAVFMTCSLVQFHIEMATACEGCSCRVWHTSLLTRCHSRHTAAVPTASKGKIFHPWLPFISSMSPRPYVWFCHAHSPYNGSPNSLNLEFQGYQFLPAPPTPNPRRWPVSHMLREIRPLHQLTTN